MPEEENTEEENLRIIFIIVSSHSIVHYKLSLILVKQFFSWNIVYWEGLLLRGLEINILLSEDWLTMDPDYC